MKEFYCANCGRPITTEAFVILDNYLQVKYFEDNKSNRFCSKDCAADYLCCESIAIEELPLDDDELDDDEEEDL